MLFVYLLFNFSILKHISEDGLKEIKISEGFEKNCYSDIASEATIGHGTTSFDQKIIGVKLYKGLTVTDEQAEEWLKKTIKYKYERLVNKYDKYYTFTQSQFDALVSFTYNLGEKNLNTLLQNGTRTKAVISTKILEFSNFYNKTAGKYQRSEGLYKRRQREKALFDKESPESGITNTITDLLSYKLDLGSVITYLVKENQQSQSLNEEEDMNIIYYDDNGNKYRTKCNYYFSHPSYVIKCINTESIQEKGNIYIKLDKNKKISNGDVILPFDSKNFNENKYAEFNIIDSFTKLQITYFYELYYNYYTVYAYGNYFSYIFRLSTKLKDENFPENFPIRIYMIFTQTPNEKVELTCHSNKLSMLEDDFDYEYVISCSGFSTGKIYETRYGTNYLQFRSYYQPVSPTAYNPLIMSALPTNINSTNPLSVIKIQKYDIAYQIIKTFDELQNLEITFSGIYIINQPQDIFNDYYDYGIYFITNNNEKLNSQCLINILEDSKVKLICKIDVENLVNFMDLKNGIYNSYIFISKLDIDYVFNYRKSNMVVLERFNIDIGGSILISRIDDKTKTDDLKKDIQNQDKNNDYIQYIEENMDNNNEDNIDNNNNKKTGNNNNYNNKGQNIKISKISRFMLILILLLIYL